MLNTNNMTMIEGGLTRDPEYLEDKNLVKFSVAVDGAGREDSQSGVTAYFDVVVWTNSGKYSYEALGEYTVAAIKDGTLAKGSRVKVLGRLSQDRFKTRENVNASRVYINAENIQVVWSRLKADQKAAEGGNAAAPAAARAGG